MTPRTEKSAARPDEPGSGSRDIKVNGPSPEKPPGKPGGVITKVELLPIAELHEDPANVRRHPDRNLAAIAASLARFGQQRPILVDARGIVRAGNGTLAAARSLGWTEIAVVRTGLAGAEATAYAIADNRTAELAEWDEPGLAEMLRSLQSEEDPGIFAATGFADGEVDELLGRLGDDMVPDFQPADVEDQARLDEKVKVKCPECGHEFSP